LSAHQTKPTIVDISFNKNNSISLHIQANVEALLTGISTEHEDTDDAPQVDEYNHHRNLSVTQLQKIFMHKELEYRNELALLVSNSSSGQKIEWQFEKIEIPEVGDTRLARISHIFYRAAIIADMQEVSWQYPKKYGDSIVRFVTEGIDDKTSYLLMEGGSSPVYPLNKEVKSQSRLSTAWQYIVLGYEHILPKGVDHILFVLGLFFLSTRMGPLLWQVTAFTVAHSITLGMSIYGLIALSSSIVEPLIALSIAYVGIENLLTKKLKPWRVIIVFLFGLLHGMGFASVLMDLGLPQSDFLTALITFNIGVELGQISVILGALLLVGWLSRKEQLYRYAVIIPGSLSIALIGLYWTYERIV